MFLFFPKTTTFAENEGDDKISSAIEEIIIGLDLEKLEAEFSDVPIFENSSLQEVIKKYISGETSFSPEDIFSLIISLIFTNINGFLPQICAICAICIFSSVLDAIKINSSDKSLIELSFFVISALVISLAASLYFSVFNLAKNTIESLTSQMQAAFPVIITLISASGANVTASIYQPSVAYICTFESLIAEKILFPIVILMFLFNAINSLSENIKVNKFIDFLKSTFKWISGGTSLVFCFFITAQGITSSVYDGFSIKFLKYFVGGSVPIVGQIVNGGLDIVVASCIMVKNAIGILSLIILVFTVIAPIIKIAVLSLFLRFLAAVLEPSCDSKTVKYISSVADSLNYLSAIVIIIAVVYLIMIFLAICSLGGIV